MLKNYLKIAFRYIVQHKNFALLSVISLAITFTSVILIGMYVQQELSYDRFHEKSDQIYRLTTISKNADNKRSVGFVPLPLSEHLAENFSSVKNFARVWEYRRSIPVSNPELDLIFYEDDFGWAEDTIIEIKIIGDHAYDLGYYEGKTKRPNGEVFDFHGKYVIVWKKVDGEWKIYLDMWNDRDD